MKNITKFEDLQNEIISNIELIKNNEEKVESIIFTLKTGRKFRLYHSQDCCEYVVADDINGNLDDLIDFPLLMVAEASSNNVEEISSYCFDNKVKFNTLGIENSEENLSRTWTFYKMGTINGYVDIRWIGESNGYYSEKVDFEEIKIV